MTLDALRHRSYLTRDVIVRQSRSGRRVRGGIGDAATPTGITLLPTVFASPPAGIVARETVGHLPIAPLDRGVVAGG